MFCVKTSKQQTPSEQKSCTQTPAGAEVPMQKSVSSFFSNLIFFFFVRNIWIIRLQVVRECSCVSCDTGSDCSPPASCPTRNLIQSSCDQLQSSAPVRLPPTQADVLQSLSPVGV